MTATMFVMIRENGYGAPQVITLPLVHALLDEPLKYLLAPPADAPEPAPAPLPARLMPRSRKTFERSFRQLGEPLLD